MPTISTIEKLRRFHHRVNGSTTEYNLNRYHQIVIEIRLKEKEYQNINQDDLKLIARELSNRAKSGMCLDELLVETYALVCVVIRNVLNIIPYDEQLIGGILIYQEKLAEMQTGEGKTLTATFPVCLNALNGRGVHVLTFNDYLANRDANWMGPVYDLMGLSVGVIQEKMSVSERQKAYQADITYVTAKEAGFDYLRDCLRENVEEGVHRGFNFGVIDEADSILIDEARIPLIIAGSIAEEMNDFSRAALLSSELKKGEDIELDESARNVFLTDSGLQKVEKILGIDNLYAEDNLDSLARTQNALHVEFLLKRDVDYIVRRGRIELVDEFTGRVADNRRWPDGIQAALEAKEQVAIQKSGKILNSITIRHFIQRYQKIAGMTATAQPAEREFWNSYGLSIGVIPTHHPCIRIDHDDVVFETRSQKRQALVEEIAYVHKTGRPILVGTRSVGESTELAELLSRQRIQCQVLNAKEDESEARIIAQAGRLGAVTVSTNMAGRGVDIQLGGRSESEKKEVAALGGLYVIGTNRHDSLRIDNQLRGRSGRQGDPGSSRFFISLEDDLFEKYNIKTFLRLNSFNADGGSIIKTPLIHSEIMKFQRNIEWQNQEIKNSVLKYSEIINAQREVILADRLRYLKNHTAEDYFKQRSPSRYTEFAGTLDEKKIERLCRLILLGVIDYHWSEYLAEIGDIREGIHFRSYASASISGENPLNAYQKIAVELFDEMREKTNQNAVKIFNSIDLGGDVLIQAAQKARKPSSTWTYLINDDPFGYASSISEGVGKSLIVGVYLPILICFYSLRKVGNFLYSVIFKKR